MWKNIFLISTNILIAGIITSSIFHVILLSSDSEIYRQWVSIQILLQITAAISLWYVRQFRFPAFVLFVLISVAFVYINAVHTNYRNDGTHVILVSLFWIIYGTIVFKIRSNFLYRKKI